MFIHKTKNNQKYVIALKNIPKNTILFSEEIKFMVDRKRQNWYEELIKYELENNYEQFMDLVPYNKDKYCITDGIFKQTNNKFDLQLCYNKIIRNAFNVNIDNKQHVTVLYKGRLLNHSCDPNVLFKVTKHKRKQYM